MKRTVYYFFIINIFISCLTIDAIELKEIQTELISSKRGLEDIRKALTDISLDLKQDLETFCGDFCIQLDGVDQKYNQLIIDIQEFFKNLQKQPKEDQSSLLIAKTSEMNIVISEVKNESKSLITAYHQLLAEKIPHLNSRL